MENNPSLEQGAPSVYVLVLSYAAERGDTTECLASLQKADYPNLHIVLIDNGSYDDTVSLVRVRFPQVEIIENGRNMGFAPGNNVGITYALDRGADYVFLLNNDAIVDTTTISHLIEKAQRDAKIGIIGPAIISYHNRAKRYIGGTIFWSTGAAAENDLSGRPVPDILDTDYVSGCALLCKSSLIREIGLLEPEFFIYFEDVDWSIRCIKAGYRAVIATTTVIYHKGTPDRDGPKSALAAYYLRRNQVLFMRKYGKRRAWPGFIKAYARRNLLAIQAAIHEMNLPLSYAIIDSSWAGIWGHFGGQRIHPALYFRLAVVMLLGFWLWLTGWLYFWDYRRVKREKSKTDLVSL